MGDGYIVHRSENSIAHNGIKDMKWDVMLIERDKKRQRYAEKMSVGKSLAQAALLGPVGKGTYTRLREANYTRAVSAVAAITSNISHLHF